MTITHYEAWSNEQVIGAIAAMQAHGDEQRGHALHSEQGADLVWNRIRTGTLRAAYVGDGFLLIYDIGPTWCTEDPLFYELLLRRALPTGNFKLAIRDMKQLAKDNGCIGLMTGNGVMRPGLKRLYEHAGFRHFNEAYFTEV